MERRFQVAGRLDLNNSNMPGLLDRAVFVGWAFLAASCQLQPGEYAMHVQTYYTGCLQLVYVVLVGIYT